MKLLPVFLPVAALHVGLIVLFLAQPGCQTRPPPPAPIGAETASPRPQPAPPIVSQSTETSSSDGRQAPMRPIGSSTSSDLPSAFNAGLEIESAEPVLEPYIEPEPFESEAGPTEIYIIGKGDTLSSIARVYGISIPSLRAANNLNNDRIYVGQELQIPMSGSSTVAETTTTASSADTYVVQKGDNLTKIAQSTGSSVGEIRAANGLTSDRILVGQSLMIPSVGSGASSAPVRSASTRSVQGASYVVAPGDTLSGIGAKYGVNFRSVMKANNITDPTRLYVGQELVIPGVSASQTAVAPARVEQRTIVPPVEPRPVQQTSTPVYIAPSRPVEIEPSQAGTNQIDPAELEARLNELPISESEVVEPTE